MPYVRSWWLVDADKNRSRKFSSYEAATAAGVRAYWRKVDEGFWADDTFHIVSGGEWYSVAPHAQRVGRPGSSPSSSSSN